MATLSISSMTTLTGSANNNSCVIPVLDLQASTTSNQNKKIKISTQNQFFSNNNSVSNLSSFGNFFGTGEDGDLTVSSSVQISQSLLTSAGLNNRNDYNGNMIVKNYKNLTINSGILFTPLAPCRGLVIYCTGDLLINGTISMTSKGGGVGSKMASPLGNAPAQDSRFDLIDASIYVNNLSSSARGFPTHWNWAPSGSQWFDFYKIRLPLSGSVAGGASTPSSPAATTGQPGTAGLFCCGGGGAGGANGSNAGATTAGGRGTIFAGGAGGGAQSAGNPSAGSAAIFEIGGASGAALGGGGAGNPAGVAASFGVGGLIILIVRGNITINGTVSSNGSNGGATAPGPSAATSGGGGGSGGGRVMIIYGGTYSNLGTLTTNGGSGGTSPGAGGAGGAGSTLIRKIHT